jgi:hypothetical protein
MDAGVDQVRPAVPRGAHATNREVVFDDRDVEPDSRVRPVSDAQARPAEKFAVARRTSLCTLEVCAT